MKIENQRNEHEIYAQTRAITVSSSFVLLFFCVQLYPRLLPENRVPLFLLMGIGGGASLMALLPKKRSYLFSIMQKIGRFFGVHPAQLWCLCLALCFSFLARISAGNGLMAYHGTISSLSWLIACGLIVVGAWRSGYRYRLPKWEVGLLLILFLLAYLVRGIATASYPPIFTGDEASAGLSAVSYIEGDADNWFIMGWFSFPALFYVIQSIPIRLFGQTIEATRLLGVLAGSGTVVLLYLLVRSMFTRKTAVLSAGYLLVAHYHIQFSRIALQNIWDGLFTVIALLGLWHGWKTSNRNSFILGGLGLGLGQYFYVSYRAVPAIVLLWVCVAAVFDWKTFKARIADLLIAVYAAVIVYLPLALFYIAEPHHFEAPMKRVTVFDGWLTETALKNETTEMGIMLRQMWLTAKGFTHEPMHRLFYTDAPMLESIGGMLFLLGIVFLLVRFNLRHFMLLLPIVVVIAAGTFSSHAPSPQRLVIAAPSIAAVIGIILAQIMQIFESAWNSKKWVIWGGMGLFMALISYQNLTFYFTEAFPDGYKFGGGNTWVATDIATYLEDQHPETIQFYGWPQMNYRSISTLPYFADHISTDLVTDVIEPLTAVPTAELTIPAIFLFLPGRVEELDFVQQAYPNGKIVTYTNDQDEYIFTAYHIDSSE